MVFYKQTNFTHVIVAFSLSILIAGCAGTEKKEQAPEDAKKESAALSQISPEAQKKYDSALVAMRANDAGKAKQLLTELVVTYPELSGPQANLGILYYRNNEIDLAEKAFSEAIKVNPNSAVSYNHLGIINRNKGNFKEAQDLYEKALKIDPDYAYAHLNLGILLDLYIGDLDKALEHYQHYQKLSKDEDKDVNKWIIDLERRIKSKK